jgi:hypothetical protein
MFPELGEQLPMMITSLDEDEYIDTERIRSNDGLRRYLERDLLPLLPVEFTPSRGWSRSCADVSISAFLADHFAFTGEAVPVPEAKAGLSAAQSTAYRIGAPRLLQLLSDLPGLKNELSGFLLSMEEGNRVLLDEMEDEVVGEALNRFLKSVGMEEGKQRE